MNREYMRNVVLSWALTVALSGTIMMLVRWWK